ncbi:hypothetical protein Pmani_014592 [Petrolisthes manimaculis]|uniref:Uncharacterized protein n=1 Tax=Petrolisthes manimaculis TaxID=1843537 RepID=A0AAE1U873_9EUCA|nr:hypothetical protein Pmani_014592 [Petrolisthes manimaculis]
MRTGIGSLVDGNGEVSDRPESIVETLRLQYEAVFSSPRGDSMVLDPVEFFDGTEGNTEELNSICISTDHIRNAIHELRVNSAAGPDQFPAEEMCKRVEFSSVHIL